MIEKIRDVKIHGALNWNLNWMKEMIGFFFMKIPKNPFISLGASKTYVARKSAVIMAGRPSRNTSASFK